VIGLIGVNKDMSKRILVFCPLPYVEPFIGGLRSMVIDMAEALTTLGHKVEIALFEKSKHICTTYEPITCEKFPAALFKSFRASCILLHNLDWGKKWHQYLEKFDAAVVVCGSPYSAFMFLQADAPVYVWAAVTMKEDLKGRYEVFNTMKKIIYRIILPLIYAQERAVVKDSTHLWALSNPTMQDFQNIIEKTHSSMSVLLPRIDTAYFCPPKQPPSDPTILFTGRYNDGRKDISVLIRALSIIRRHIPAAKLILIGEDMPAERISFLIHHLGLSDAVEILPPMERRKLREYYQSAQAFAIPSRQEGLCISGVEAMSCGVPVVSTMCGGPESYVEDGKSGFLVPVHDHATMAERLRQILSDRSLSNELSNNARRFVLEHCGLSAFEESISEVIQ